MIDFENLDKCLFHGVGYYDIPQIEPVTEYPDGEFIPMNYANKEKNPAEKIIHCFVHDYQFSRYWNRPDNYIQRLSQFRAVCSPDFSTYTDMPLAMQIYNHYRKHWIAAYWQRHGITVYPSISWSDERSFEWCFDGEPRRSVVVISSVGTQADKKSKRLFIRGYEEMMDRLKPLCVICYGRVPKECGQKIIGIPPYYDVIVNRRKGLVK